MDYDLSDPTNLNKYFHKNAVVFHLAALADIVPSIQNPEAYFKSNVTATFNVVNAARNAGVKRLIYAASSSCYGIPESYPTPESADVTPQYPYALTKLKEEDMIKKKCNKEGLKGVILRLGTIFGKSPGMRFHTAINKFCWQAVMKTPLTVWETAYDQKRPYLDLTDAVRSIAFFIETNQFDGRVYNVVTLNATVKKVIDTIQTFIPNLKIEFVDSQIMNQLSYEVLNTRLDEKEFNFQGDLKQGIKETISLLQQARTIKQ